MLMRFIDGHSMVTEHLLLLMGPIKSGKSTVLSEVIPGLIMANLKDGVPRPAFLIHVFGPTSEPDDAAHSLLLAAQRLASQLGIPLRVGDRPHDSLLTMDVTLGELADAVARQGRRLWILLDEVQVRPRSTQRGRKL